MQLHKTHQSISHTIEAILKRGGQKLYDKYINQKLTNHTSQQTSHIIDRNIGVPFMYTTLPVSINKQCIPQGSQKDSIFPNRVNIVKKLKLDQAKNYSNITIKGNLSLRVSKKQQEQNNQKNSDLGSKNGAETQRITIKKFKPKIKQRVQNNLKYLPNPQQQKLKLNEQKEQKELRIYKIQSQKQQQKLLSEQKRISNQKLRKKRRLVQRFQQLAVLGMPYAYDDDANIYSPDPKQFKAEQKQIDHKNNRIIGLKHQTIDLGAFQKYVKDSKHVVGRKKGYFSNQFYKRLKLTNEEYNNQNSRQNTSVPFVNLSQGIKIVQRQRNIVVQKNKKHSINLQQYKQNNQSNFFRSYVPEYNPFSLMQTINSERPNTTGKFNRSKKTSQTTMSNKIKNSILWRPNTSSKNCRMRITNQQLAKEVIQFQEND